MQARSIRMTMSRVAWARRLTTLAAGLALAALTAAPALAAPGTQKCYVPEKPNGPPTLYAKPSRTAKALGRLEPGQIIVRFFKIKDRGEWMFVHWFKDQTDKKPAGKGWVVALDVYGGECED